MSRSFMELSVQDKAATTAGSKKSQNKGNSTDTALLSLEKSIFRLQTDIDKYMTFVDQLGTAKDTVTLRASISLRKDEIQKNAKSLKDRFSELNKSKHEMSNNQQERLKKSVSRFADNLNKFQKALKVCSEREVASPPIVKESTSLLQAESVENEHILRLQQQQEVQRLDNMIAYNEAIIDERDTEIQGLVQDIGELHEMFQDVAIMVHEQGQMLDNIETNANVTADHVEEGKTQLERAEESQRAASRKKMCLAAVAGLIVGTIGAILILTA